MTWIVGKNKSILTFPSDFFTGKNSIGINSAAILLRTSMAFSCYPMCVKDYLANGFTLGNIIGVHPSVTIADQRGKPDWPNLHPGTLNDPIYYDNNTLGQLSMIPGEVDRAMRGAVNKPYHNNATSLHLLIYWCILHKRYPLRLCGCNQTQACMSGQNEYPDAVKWAASQTYTRTMIKEFNKHGDIIRYYEDYADCLEQEKRYAELCKPEGRIS